MKKPIFSDTVRNSAAEISIHFLFLKENAIANTTAKSIANKPRIAAPQLILGSDVILFLPNLYLVFSFSKKNSDCF